MKGDFTRHTFDPSKHYASVRLQQGRVQLDADWNEQADIVRHRAETDTLDTVGACGAPMHDAAFRVTTDPAELDAEAAAHLAEVLPGGLQPGDFVLSRGRYYVDGILCENEVDTPYTLQPSLPGVAPIDLSTPGFHILYLDVWRRHVTALEAPLLRESALGGPDTATRLQTVWQVRALPVGTTSVGCHDPVAAYDDATAASTGTLRARAEAESAADDPCLVPPSAGFRGLENQLYRVEIHHAGAAVDVTSGSGHTEITELPAVDQVRAAGGTWNVGDVVEVYLAGAGADPLEGHLAVVTAKSGRLLTLNRPLPGLALEDQPRLRRVGATYKWSRDNGIVVTGITAVDADEITVEDLGLDEILGFEPGQWVEIIDHERELNGVPGELAQVEAVNPATRVVSLHAAPAWPGDLATVDPSRGLRLRRWDGVGAVKLDPSAAAAWVELEDGVEVEFDDGDYHTGDYWMIPARTATADARSGRVEWPLDAAGAPVRRGAFGIRHHYCRIGVIEVDGDGNVTVEDCRRLFPPATEHLRLVYIGGDGQESLPGEPLAKPLEVGVFNGSHGVAGIVVEFTTVPGGRLATSEAGLASGGNVLPVATDEHGIARCHWRLKNDVAMATQQVRARIVDADGTPVPEDPYIRFTANLSLAERVAYDPGECAGLAGQDTVQKAIDRLAAAASLHILEGNGQEVRPGEPLGKKLKVLVASACGPVSDPEVKVRFEVTGGSGSLDGGGGSAEVPVQGDGTASCTWELDGSTQNQEVTATLVAGARPTAEPTAVRFTATLSDARHVGFEPDKCGDMAAAGIRDVQAALEFLCARETHGGGCSITVGKGGQFPTLREAFAKLRGVPDVSLCLLPGDHTIDRELRIPIDPQKDRTRRVSIAGSGPGCRVHLEGSMIAAISLESLRLSDFDLYAAGSDSPVRIHGCADVMIRGCRFRQVSKPAALVTVTGTDHFRLLDSTLVSMTPPASEPDLGGFRLATMLDANDLAAVRRWMRDLELWILKAEPEIRTAYAEWLAGAMKVAGGGTATTTFTLAAIAPIVGTPTLDEDIPEVPTPEVPGIPAEQPPTIRQMVHATATLMLARALVFADSAVTAAVEGCELVGTLHLYGEGGDAAIDGLREIAPMVREGKLRLRGAGGELQLRGSRVSRLTVDATTLEQIQENPDLLHRVLLAGNALLLGGSMFVAENATLDSNHFFSTGTVGVGAATTGIVTGNGPSPRSTLELAVPPGAGRHGQSNLIQVAF